MTGLVKPENDTQGGLEPSTFCLEGFHSQKPPKNSTAFYASKQRLKQVYCDKR